MEEMRKAPKWVFSLAKAADAETQEGWCRGHRGPPQWLRISLETLAEAQVLSAATISRIECCFSSLKVHHGGRQQHLCYIAMVTCLLTMLTCSLAQSLACSLPC